MKLRNKRTGEIDDFLFDEVITGRIDLYRRVGTSETKNIWHYNSLAELNEEWEDAEDIDVPSMPLIKDKRIRKAVRAWAEANKINKCKCSDEIHCITFETERGMFISFENTDYIPPEGNFTIAELCGEDDNEA